MERKLECGRVVGKGSGRLVFELLRLEMDDEEEEGRLKVVLVDDGVCFWCRGIFVRLVMLILDL